MASPNPDEDFLYESRFSDLQNQAGAVRHVMRNAATRYPPALDSSSRRGNLLKEAEGRLLSTSLSLISNQAAQHATTLRAGNYETPGVQDALRGFGERLYAILIEAPTTSTVTKVVHELSLVLLAKGFPDEPLLPADVERGSEPQLHYSEEHAEESYLSPGQGSWPPSNGWTKTFSGMRKELEDELAAFDAGHYEEEGPYDEG